ncbi:MAG: ABC transporter ATP-binding protein, partial [Steroidobacteraceae bacterium]
GPAASAAQAPARAARAAGPAPRRLSYKEQRELAGLPERLEQLEGGRQRLEAELADPALYRGTQEALQERLQQLAALIVQIDAAYARWSELDTLAAGS